MKSVILANTYVKDIKRPLIYLAGPVRCAPKWQDEAIEVLVEAPHKVVIATPTTEVKESLKRYLMPGDKTHFERQRAWERHYLDIASRNGAIMFWLPGAEHHDCAKVYGVMTRLELGQWLTRHMHDKSVRLCIGTDGRFPEFDTIKYDISQDAPELEIKRSLKETCLEALRLSGDD